MNGSKLVLQVKQKKKKKTFLIINQSKLQSNVNDVEMGLIRQYHVKNPTLYAAPLLTGCKYDLSRRDWGDIFFGNIIIETMDTEKVFSINAILRFLWDNVDKQYCHACLWKHFQLSTSVIRKQMFFATQILLTKQYIQSLSYSYRYRGWLT